MEKLIKYISIDLSIKQFKNESCENYLNRLVYSALCSWTRNMVYDKSFYDVDNDYNGVKKSHIINRLTQIVHSFNLSIIKPKKLQSYFLLDENKLAIEIFKYIVFTYECSKTLEENYIPTPTNYIKFKDLSLKIGSKNSFRQSIYVGCGKWVTSLDKDISYNNFFNIPIDINEYYHSLIDNAIWYEDNKLEKSLKFYYLDDNTWKYTKISNLKKGIFLFEKEKNKYYLLKKENDLIQVSTLKDWYYYEKEIYRIMYALKSHNYVQTIFKYTKFKDYVVLNINDKIPNGEKRILLLSSWGLNSFSDLENRIIPINIWSNIKIIFENLGIILKEN